MVTLHGLWSILLISGNTDITISCTPLRTHNIKKPSFGSYFLIENPLLRQATPKSPYIWHWISLSSLMKASLVGGLSQLIWTTIYLRFTLTILKWWLPVGYCLAWNSVFVQNSRTERLPQLLEFQLQRDLLERFWWFFCCWYTWYSMPLNRISTGGGMIIPEDSWIRSISTFNDQYNLFYSSSWKRCLKIPAWFLEV